MGNRSYEQSKTYYYEFVNSDVFFFYGGGGLSGWV